MSNWIPGKAGNLSLWQDSSLSLRSRGTQILGESVKGPFETLTWQSGQTPSQHHTAQTHPRRLPSAAPGWPWRRRCPGRSGGLAWNSGCTCSWRLGSGTQHLGRQEKKNPVSGTFWVVSAAITTLHHITLPRCGHHAENRWVEWKNSIKIWERCYGINDVPPLAAATSNDKIPPKKCFLEQIC